MNRLQRPQYYATPIELCTGCGGVAHSRRDCLHLAVFVPTRRRSAGWGLGCRAGDCSGVARTDDSGDFDVGVVPPPPMTLLAADGDCAPEALPGTRGDDGLDGSVKLATGVRPGSCTGSGGRSLTGTAAPMVVVDAAGCDSGASGGGGSGCGGGGVGVVEGWVDGRGGGHAVAGCSTTAATAASSNRRTLYGGGAAAAEPDVPSGGLASGVTAATSMQYAASLHVCVWA